MNIKRAKQEIKDAIEAYLARDAYRGIPDTVFPAKTRASDRSAGNRKNADYGTDCKGVRGWTGGVYHHPPHQAKRHRASLYLTEGVWRQNLRGDGIYHE